MVAFLLIPAALALTALGVGGAVCFYDTGRAGFARVASLSFIGVVACVVVTLVLSF